MNKHNKVPKGFGVLVQDIKTHGIEVCKKHYGPLFKTGDYLRALRISRNETQEYVAVRAEIFTSQVSRIERNVEGSRHGFSMLDFKKLCNYYKVPFSLFKN